MSYLNRILEEEQKGYRRSVAIKILDSMENLRLTNNIDNARRWVWELLQNAKDSAFIGKKLEVELNYDDDRKTLEFLHNGKPFTTSNITALIEQVSSKERDDEEKEESTTGRFGTGFLATHVLSEIVKVESVLQDMNEPCRKFSLTLDRSGSTAEEISKAIDNTFNQLKNIDNCSIMSSYIDLSTKFTYCLDEKSSEIAKIGIEDLIKCIIYVFAFVPSINSISFRHLQKKFYLKWRSKFLNSDITCYGIEEQSPIGATEHIVAIHQRDNVMVALPINKENNNIEIKKINNTIPKLFCVFPLIGTEDFPFPIVVNCSTFYTTEPRNGIHLTDKPREKIAKNKNNILIAVDLFYELIDYAAMNRWQKTYNLIPLKKAFEAVWLSDKWYDHYVVNKIYQKLLYTPIIDTLEGQRVAFQDAAGNQLVWFPHHKDQQTREAIWDLCRAWIPQMLPIKDEIHSWYSVLWCESGRLTLNTIASSIHSKKDLPSLLTELHNTVVTDWLNQYYSIINQNKTSLEEIIDKGYKIFPNQKGIFKSKSEISIDTGIDEELKNVMGILGKDCRESLLNIHITPPQLLDLSRIDQEQIISYINKALDKEFMGDEINIEACIYLSRLFVDDASATALRNQLYRFTYYFLQPINKEKLKIHSWDNNIWEVSDRKIVKQIAKVISQCQTLENLNAQLNLKSINDTKQLINEFIEFLNENDFSLFESKTLNILPNQNGYFTTKDGIFLDDGEIDEILKDISYDLGCDIRAKLLDKSINIDLPNSRTKTNRDVAEQINSLLNPRINEYPRTDETKIIFKKIIVWFHNNSNKASQLFGELYINKHKLYDDNEIALNIERAEQVTKLLTELNMTNISELREAIVENKDNKNYFEMQTQITRDILLSLGISTAQELESAFKDANFSKQFIHTSTPSFEMFQYVQLIIERAKNNVKNYLQTLAEYDCSDMEELAPTIIGGVKKNGVDINVLVRPSDNGMVIFYYTSEKDILDVENSELWIDNGISTPSILTLGKILKMTGINRIPVA